ncbi:MAG: class I SAM-dependent methyltransferase [Chitinispirillaceae bacterium]|jgi:SAM-dependent methyltransferase|nr:class I SAM-dependent methyltransferase [Chitinispirillaceae bacterium]
MTPATPRSFSEEKHGSGQWQTRTLFLRNPLARALCNYLSFKRDGVDQLAAAARAVKHTKPIVIDSGSGQGAYSHWYSGRADATIIAIDWSAGALSRIAPARRGKILRVCADAQNLPLKPECADALFSIDTLGHVPSVTRALDEMLRIVKPGARIFLHSECSSYRTRWPDSMLIRRIGYDYLAEYDGHVSLMPMDELHTVIARRFRIDSYWSPAGITGWLTGHPEKYRLAFVKARLPLLAGLTALSAFCRRLPVIGILLRLKNSMINRLELGLGLQGGGSFFALCRKPERVKILTGEKQENDADLP